VITAKALSDNVAFGTILFIHAYMLFFSAVASLKTWQAIIRFGSDEVKAKNSERFSQLIKTGILIDAIVAVIAFLAATTCFSLFLWVQTKLGTDFANQQMIDQSGADLKQVS